MMDECKWQWALETDNGGYIAGCAVLPDGDRRGWFAGVPGVHLKSGVQLKPLIRLWKIFQTVDLYDEIRAWVMTDDAQAVMFAERFGFMLDCGPATGFSPSGRDMSLFIWRK